MRRFSNGAADGIYNVQHPIAPASREATRSQEGIDISGIDISGIDIPMSWHSLAHAAANNRAH